MSFDPYLGSCAISLMVKNSCSQQINFGPTIHATLEELDPIDLPFYRTIVPFENQPSLNSVLILAELADERTPLSNPTIEGCPKPAVEFFTLLLEVFGREPIPEIEIDPPEET